MRITVAAGTQVNDAGTVHDAGDTFEPTSDTKIVDQWIVAGIVEPAGPLAAERTRAATSRVSRRRP